MNNTNYLARYDASYWAMRRKAERAGILTSIDKKGPCKATLTRYGRKHAPNSEAARVRLSGRG